MTPDGPWSGSPSTAEIALDDRAYAAWSAIALHRPIGPRSFGVKDVIDVEGMPTACGFEPWRDRAAAEDAAVVRRLRTGGWEPIGKTHTAQFAYADPPPTLNPTDPSRTPGGSSTGSAVAVARGHVPMALGTQTGGSTIRPAAYCGVVGMKPSFGILPVDGIHPVSPSLDTVGIIAATTSIAAEAAHALGAIDGAGLGTARAAQTPATVAMFDDADSLLEDAAAEAAWQHVTTALTDGIVTRTTSFPAVDLARVIQLHIELMAIEAWPYHADLAATAEASYYGPKMRRLLEIGRELAPTTPPKERLVPLRSELDGLARAVPDDGVLLMPATVGSPPARTGTGSSRLCMPWTVLGRPVVVVPWRVTLSDGSTEVGGVQVVGQHGADDVVLAVAANVEQRLRTAGLAPNATAASQV